MATPRILGDRLYGLSIRPQELDEYAQKAEVSLRYSPIFEDPDERATLHFKLMVLELSVQLEDEDQLAESAGSTLELAKCGWQIELGVDEPCGVGTLVELPEEVPLLLGRIAETINGLCVRAGLETPPLSEELITSLIESYQAQRPPKIS